VSRDLRRHDRLAVNYKVEMVWLNEHGETCFARCMCKDISVSGMRLESPEPVPVRTYVNFHISRLEFRGTGSVRSCVHKGMKYHLGVEFGGSLIGERLFQRASKAQESELATLPSVPVV